MPSKRRGLRPIRSLDNNLRVKAAVEQIVADILNNPLTEGENVNIIGTSMGSVTAAQAALCIIESREGLGLPEGCKIDDVILAGAGVDNRSKLSRTLKRKIESQGGKLRDGIVDQNGENGYNYPPEIDGVTGVAGRTKAEAVENFKTLLG